MKKTLFIMTHLGSEYELLVEKLQEDRRFHFFGIRSEYHHPEDLEMLTNNNHKQNNSSAVWVDVILHNKDFTCRALCKYSKFIYWSKPYEECQINLKRPKAYYDYRIEGMKQYHKRTGGLWNPSIETDFSFDSVCG